ncbi:hypothetical protein ACRAWD_18960 [Caulobacter segnis]
MARQTLRSGRGAASGARRVHRAADGHVGGARTS